MVGLLARIRRHFYRNFGYLIGLLRVYGYIFSHKLFIPMFSQSICQRTSDKKRDTVLTEHTRIPSKEDLLQDMLSEGLYTSVSIQ